MKFKKKTRQFNFVRRWMKRRIRCVGCCFSQSIWSLCAGAMRKKIDLKWECVLKCASLGGKFQNNRHTWHEFNGAIFGDCPFLWAALNLHLTFDHFARLQRPKEEIAKTNKSIVCACARALITYCMETIRSIWISCKEAEETETSKKKRTYNGPIARRKRVLVMAGIESHFAQCQWF